MIVGNEILDGRRRDFHFADTLEQLQKRSLSLAYTLLMEAFIQRHPTVSFSSLPHLDPSGNYIELGLSGSPDAVSRGVDDLCRVLLERQLRFESA